MNMKIMVTGGAGFIGGWLSKRLLNDGHQVVVVDNLSTGQRDNVPRLAEFLLLDLANEDSFRKLPEDIDMVYHLASQASGEVSYEDPVHDLKANSLATLALLNWAKEKNVNKFIFTSTMGIYQDHLSGPAQENSPIGPKSFYGLNKQASEGFIRIFSEEGMRTTVLRLFNVYGPGQNMENLKQGMLSIYMAYIAKKQPILVKGPLDRFRDFVYIDDVVNALMVAQSPVADGGTFNVCTGRKTMVKEAIEIIIRAFGEDTDAYPLKNTERTPRDIDGCFGDYRKIEATLGWRPLISLEEGVEKMTNWLCKGETEIGTLR
jgi:UDP-glucose 4-epimerase